MIRRFGFTWLAYGSGIVVFFIASGQIGYSQTVDEFMAANRLEQRRMVERIVSLEIEQLTSKSVNGRRKARQELTNERRLANYVRAFFTDYGITQSAGYEPEGIDNLRFHARTFKKQYAMTPLREFLKERVKEGHEVLYTKSTGTWRNQFDTKTDRQQVALFRAEKLNIRKASAQAYSKYVDSQIEEANVRRDQALAKIKRNDEQYGDITKKRNEIRVAKEIVTIELLKVDIRPSATDSEVDVLVFRNEVETPVTFKLKCYSQGEMPKTAAVSVPANGESEIVFLRHGRFILGKRCEFYHGGEIVRRFEHTER